MCTGDTCRPDHTKDRRSLIGHKEPEAEIPAFSVPPSGTLSHLKGTNRGSSHTLPGQPSDRVPPKNQRPTRLRRGPGRPRTAEISEH
jgi:hypothetical protein